MRLILFRLGIYLGLIVLGTGLFWTQVVQGEYYRVLGDKNRMRLVPLEAPRGRVFDRHGRLLAANRPAYDVIAMPHDVTQESILQLGEILGLSPEEITKRLQAPREYRFSPAIVQEDVGRDLAFLIEENRPYLQGVDIQVSGLRHYPYKQTASHLIGFIGKINSEEYQRLRDEYELYGLNSFIGRIGIERLFDRKLRGTRGGRQLEVDARGRLVRVLSEKDPEPGENLNLTIDLELQKRIMDLIGERHAAVAVLDLESEEILALASSPAFDPNVFVTPGHGEERLALLRDESAPMLERGAGASYPPGSVFKLVTALAALETGKITPQTTFHCPGHFQLRPNTRPRKCWFAQGHGSIDLPAAIKRSCNVYFYHLGRILGPDEIARYSKILGLGEGFQMELSSVNPGLVPDSEWKKETFKERWYQGESLSYAIGQSYLLTSPAQILRLVAIIAKDGQYVEPKLLKGPGEESKREGREVAIQKSYFQVLKKGMAAAVQSDYGTGQLARVDFGRMAAKTGTAQVPPKETHAWMAGFFPYETPQIAFVAFVEHGGSGGIEGGRIVKGLVEAWWELYGSTVA